MDLVDILKKGRLAVIPTDTIYGIVGSALNQKTVEKIYKLRKRTLDKPMIILISDIIDLQSFNISLTEKQKKFLQKVWPNPVSVILPMHSEKWKYLHRGTNSLAFRMPKRRQLRDLLKQVGPLVAPSANFEGKKVSQTIDEAKKYFGKKVAFYVDGGKLTTEPSTIIQLSSDGLPTILRQGLYKTRKLL